MLFEGIARVLQILWRDLAPDASGDKLRELSALQKAPTNEWEVEMASTHITGKIVQNLTKTDTFLAKVVKQF